MAYTVMAPMQSGSGSGCGCAVAAGHCFVQPDSNGADGGIGVAVVIHRAVQRVAKRSCNDRATLHNVGAIDRPTAMASDRGGPIVGPTKTLRNET